MLFPSKEWCATIPLSPLRVYRSIWGGLVTKRPQQLLWSTSWPAALAIVAFFITLVEQKDVYTLTSQHGSANHTVCSGKSIKTAKGHWSTSMSASGRVYILSLDSGPFGRLRRHPEVGPLRGVSKARRSGVFSGSSPSPNEGKVEHL